MRWPYNEPIKARYFAERGLALSEVWWDREVVPLAWINEQLEAGGHLWRADVVADEYEFTDVG
ncbi:MAG TPA: hypothetical protein VN806_13040 [Caulobacteraceae bacterium]|nr:hypothetical protein [Caulobacteraceae bacterium]